MSDGCFEEFFLEFGLEGKTDRVKHRCFEHDRNNNCVCKCGAVRQ